MDEKIEIAENKTINIANKKVCVVLIGFFNPAMFHPIWFKSNKIINSSEIDLCIEQKQCIISPEFTLFHTDQLEVKVENNRFIMTAMKEPFINLMDTIKKTFENLNTIPTKAMGINFLAHYIMPDIENYHKIGDIIAPKEGIWNLLLKENITGNNRKGGLFSIRMTNQKENQEGSINVRFEKSNKYDKAIFIETNDHYQFKENIDMDIAMQILEQNFIRSIDDSFKIQQSIFNKLKNEKND